MNKTGITFPILNNLTPTVESCTMKVLEEVGELMQLIGKGQGRSGENLINIGDTWAVYSISEALDVAQSAITMAHMLCEKYEFDLETMMKRHTNKLKEKGYLV
jgi:NTP pyrophosphatase (non-canonical NTP hydrolase)